MGLFSFLMIWRRRRSSRRNPTFELLSLSIYYILIDLPLCFFSGIFHFNFNLSREASHNCDTIKSTFDFCFDRFHIFSVLCLCSWFPCVFLAMALGQAATFACATSTLGILSFILGIIAENKKVILVTCVWERERATANPIRKIMSRNIVTLGNPCWKIKISSFPKDPWYLCVYMVTSWSVEEVEVCVVCGLLRDHDVQWWLVWWNKAIT